MEKFEAREDLITLTDLCHAIKEERKDAAYLVARGIKPPDVPEHLKQGLKLRLTYKQAFWMAFLIKLYARGVPARLCNEIVQASHSLLTELRGKTMFDPFAGTPTKGTKWFVEVGDQRAIRLVRGGDFKAKCFPWHSLKRVQVTKNEFEPEFVIRINLDGIAEVVFKLYVGLRAVEKQL